MTTLPYSTTAHVTQRGIVAFVADRGYLDGYTLDQRIARQLVKQLEETCEAMQAVRDFDRSSRLSELVDWANILGRHARSVFDIPSLFDDVTVDVPKLIDELPDMVVPLAVLADAVGIPDMLAAALEKARMDVARGVREAKTQQAYEDWIVRQPLSEEAVEKVWNDTLRR